MYYIDGYFCMTSCPSGDILIHELVTLLLLCKCRRNDTANRASAGKKSKTAKKNKGKKSTNKADNKSIKTGENDRGGAQATSTSMKELKEASAAANRFTRNRDADGKQAPLRNYVRKELRWSLFGKMGVMNQSWIMVVMRIAMRIMMRVVLPRRDGAHLQGRKIRPRHHVVAVAGWMTFHLVKMRLRGKNMSKLMLTIFVKLRCRDIVCRYGAMNLILPILLLGRMSVSRLEWTKVRTSLAIGCVRLKVSNRGMSTNFRKAGMGSRSVLSSLFTCVHSDHAAHSGNVDKSNFYFMLHFLISLF